VTTPRSCPRVTSIPFDRSVWKEGKCKHDTTPCCRGITEFSRHAHRRG